MSVGTGRSGLSIWLSGSLGVALLLAAACGLLHLWRCGHFAPWHSFSADLGAGRSLTIKYRPLPGPAEHLRVCLVLNSPTAGTIESAAVRRGRLPNVVEFRGLAGKRVWVVVQSGTSGRAAECALSVPRGQVWHAGSPEGLPAWAESDGGELLARWTLLADGTPPVYVAWDRRARGTLLAAKPRVEGEPHALCLRSGDLAYRDARPVGTPAGAVLVCLSATGEWVPCAEWDRSLGVLVDADRRQWRLGHGEKDQITRGPRRVADYSPGAYEAARRAPKR